MNAAKHSHQKHSHPSASGSAKTAFAPSQAWASTEKPVLLTFDDGPCLSSTSMILEILSTHNIKAIFFVVGERLEKPENQDLVHRMIADGHIVGNHSYSHPDLCQRSREEITTELAKTQAIIEKFGVSERLFRPPFGNANRAVLEVMRTMDFTGLGWNASGKDWSTEFQPTGWINRAIDEVGRNRESVVLLHDIQKTTAEGLQEFIVELKKLGCGFPPLFCPDKSASAESSREWTLEVPGWRMLRTFHLLQPWPIAVP